MSTEPTFLRINGTEIFNNILSQTLGFGGAAKTLIALFDTHSDHVEMSEINGGRLISRISTPESRNNNAAVMRYEDRLNEEIA